MPALLPELVARVQAALPPCRCMAPLRLGSVWDTASRVLAEESQEDRASPAAPPPSSTLLSTSASTPQPLAHAALVTAAVPEPLLRTPSSLAVQHAGAFELLPDDPQSIDYGYELLAGPRRPASVSQYSASSSVAAVASPAVEQAAAAPVPTPAPAPAPVPAPAAPASVAELSVAEPAALDAKSNDAVAASDAPSFDLQDPTMNVPGARVPQPHALGGGLQTLSQREAVVQHLFQMGFYDRALNARLADKHGDNVPAIVTDLLAAADSWAARR